MPLIKVIDSIKIYIYLSYDNAHHFLVIYAEYEELIDMRTLTTYSGSVPNKQRKKVIKWAEENEAYLHEKWVEYNPDKTAE